MSRYHFLRRINFSLFLELQKQAKKQFFQYYWSNWLINSKIFSINFKINMIKLLFWKLRWVTVKKSEKLRDNSSSLRINLIMMKMNFNNNKNSKMFNCAFKIFEFIYWVNNTNKEISRRKRLDNLKYHHNIVRINKSLLSLKQLLWRHHILLIKWATSQSMKGLLH